LRPSPDPAINLRVTLTDRVTDASGASGGRNETNIAGAKFSRDRAKD
jgi:hypothetical protein